MERGQWQSGIKAFQARTVSPHLDDVLPPAHVLQDLDLPFDLLLLDGLQYFDDALGVVGDVHALEDFRVLAPADLAHDLVVVLGPPGDGESLVVPVFARPVNVYVGVHSCYVWGERAGRGAKRGAKGGV